MSRVRGKAPVRTARFSRLTTLSGTWGYCEKLGRLVVIVLGRRRLAQTTGALVTRGFWEHWGQEAGFNCIACKKATMSRDGVLGHSREHPVVAALFSDEVAAKDLPPADREGPSRAFVLRGEAELIIGGLQGSGLEMASTILAYSLARLNYRVLSAREHFSNIKWRHSYIHVKASSRKAPRVLSLPPVQALAAMDVETLFAQADSLESRGCIVYDTSVGSARLDQIHSVEEQLRNRPRRFPRRLE